ncbi:extracellular solute-binding protein [Kitasatospora fiedleri]|uniref:extracellular solute-binding protein n=1 Tax=Kitasatospora fiedleri TaxID=2991545 RepID=UPI00249BA436|nr:extracellular solute-binding protein [Kitasatospora fiedleri]
MNHSRRGPAAVLALSAALALSACSSAATDTGADSGPKPVDAVKGEGRTLTVWVMDGDYSDPSLQAVNDAFTQQTGAKVNVQVQAWDGIETKVTTALATSNPPDVLDLGNTQVASFAANGGLKDLTAYAADLKQGQTWLPGLVDPATVDGRLYAVPGFAGARAVIYNKTMWADAGVTAPPTTFAELTDDLAKVKAAHPAADFSPLYFPGQNWYAGMQFVWDAGGDLATRSGAKWTAGLGSDQAQAGLADFKAFQNQFSTPASQTVDAAGPDQVQVFADGKASAIIATSGFVGRIQKANPKLTDADLGTFPMPGKSGKTQPVMIGGSDWGIAARSANADLALVWSKIAASPDVQSKWVVGHEGFIPNSTEGIKAATDQVGDLKKAFFTAALNSKATPANANWAQLEGNKDINNLFAALASGSKSAKDAAHAFDTAADTALNAGQ